MSTIYKAYANGKEITDFVLGGGICKSNMGRQHFIVGEIWRVAIERNMFR